MNNRNLKILYFIIGIFILGIFIGFLYKPLSSAFYEEDMWWYVSSIHHDTNNMPLKELVTYIIKPTQFYYPLPYFKLAPVINLTLFGPQLKYFIILSLAVFIAIAILLFYLAKNLHLEPRICFLSSIMFLTAFIHFHAYAWPVALQHLLVVFFICSILNFYLAADSAMGRPKKFVFYYSLTIIFALLSSFARTMVVIAPLLILLHILFYSQDSRQRLKKYDLWMPVFAVYLVYPVIMMKNIGDDALMFIFSKYKLPFNLPTALFIGIAVLLLFRFFLLFLANKKPKLNNKRLLLLFFGCVFLLFVLRNVRNLLLPYNIFLPFMGFMQSIFTPLQTTLQTNSTQPYYYIPLWHNVAFFFLALLSFVIFAKEFLVKRKELFLLIAWYLIVFNRFNLENVMPSRYFIYVTPVFCVIFSSSAVYLFDRSLGKLQLKYRLKEMITGLILACFFLQGITAIKLSLWRGKFTNTFMLYDYIRIANSLRNNIPGSASPGSVYINNILPMAEIVDTPLRRCDDYYNFRFVLAQVFNNKKMLGVKINRAPRKDNRTFTYTVNNGQVYDSTDSSLDRYTLLISKARQRLRQEDYSQADVFVQAALEQRPFLLNYMLSGKYDLINIKYLCGNISLREWLRLINLYYMATENIENSGKIAHIYNIANKELDDYLSALFYKSYLEYLSGNKTQSLFWFNKIVYFDDDRERVITKLKQDNCIKNGKDKDDFFNFMDSKLWFWYRDTNYVKKYRFRFQMFLFELMLDKPLFVKRSLVQD